MTYRKTRRKTTKKKVKSPRRKSIKLNPEFWLKDSTAIREWRESNIPEDLLCPILKIKPKTWTVDHCHYSNRVRGVIGQQSNTWEGYVLKYFLKYCAQYTDISLSDALRNLADYLETDYWIKNPLHYKGVEDMRKHLERCKKETIIERAFQDFGVEIKDTDEDGVRLKEDLIIEYLTHYINKYENEEV